MTRDQRGFLHTTALIVSVCVTGVATMLGVGDDTIITTVVNVFSCPLWWGG